MCLAIPGKIIAFEDQIESVFKIGKVSFGGITKNVNLGLLPEAKIGDHVLVHVGVAMSIVDEEEAQRTLDFLKGTDDWDELKDSTDIS
ncbi:hydrogenase expression/formation protein HypC [Flavobacteriaceae bacterium MAR_2010_188]|nr:hydrogenase expression/formation protein HypC [Flavobacteriaceae bacterium MAR_2010_188]